MAENSSLLTYLTGWYICIYICTQMLAISTCIQSVLFPRTIPHRTTKPSVWKATGVTGSRPWPCGLTPEKRLVSGSGCPVWPPCHSLCVCVFGCVSIWQDALCVRLRILPMCACLCVTPPHSYLTICMCAWKHGHISVLVCVFVCVCAGEPGSGRARRKWQVLIIVFAVNQRPSQACVLSCLRPEGETDNRNQCLHLLTEAKSGFISPVFLPDWQQWN